MAEERKTRRPPASRRSSAKSGAGKRASAKPASKSAAKKPAAKTRATAAAKPTARKATAARKAPAKKTTTAKKAAAKPAPRKATAAKKAPTKKTTTAKKAAAAKRPAAAKKPAATKARTAAKRAPTRPPVNVVPAEAPPTEEEWVRPISGRPGKGNGAGEPVTAPSLGPHTVIERVPAAERLAKHEQSEVDAMGKDKHRAVVGQTYGPTLARQLTLYGIFAAVVALLAIGGIALANKLDQPPDTIANQAPWAQPDAKQIPPKPIQ